MFAIVALFFSYPHLIKFADQETQGKFAEWEFKGEVLKKMSKKIINNQIDKSKNEQSKDQETE